MNLVRIKHIALISRIKLGGQSKGQANSFADPLCPSRPTAPESPISSSKGKKIAVVNHKSQNVILRSCVTLLSIKSRRVTTHTETDNRTEDAHGSAVQSKSENDRTRCGFIYYLTSATTAREPTSLKSANL